MAVLEEAEDAAAFSSGMAAITTTVLTLVSKGDHVIASMDLYGGTLALRMEKHNQNTFRTFKPCIGFANNKRVHQFCPDTALNARHLGRLGAAG